MKDLVKNIKTSDKNPLSLLSSADSTEMELSESGISENENENESESEDLSDSEVELEDKVVINDTIKNVQNLLSRIRNLVKMVRKCGNICSYAKNKIKNDESILLLIFMLDGIRHF